MILRPTPVINADSHRSECDDAAGVITLTSDRLRADVAQPGGRIYSGSRFDWTGFITQVTLDRAHTFCGPEEPVAGGTGGIGLCNEFDLNGPSSFGDGQPGEWFLKLGVGLLCRPDKRPYRFNRRYDMIPASIQTRRHRVSDGSDAVTFTSRSPASRGYEAVLSKTVTVRSNQIEVDYSLRNVGHREIRTREYNHNFLRLNQARIDEHHVLKMPCTLESYDDASTGIVGRFSPPLPPPSPFYYRATRLSPGARRWTLTHALSGLEVSEECSIPWSAFALYGSEHVLSPEAFVDIHVPPDEIVSWQRLYTFSISNGA